MANYLDESGLSYFWQGLKTKLNAKANTADLATVATSGSYNDLSNKPTIPQEYELPIASSSTLGGVKVDNESIEIDANGLIKVGELPSPLSVFRYYHYPAMTCYDSTDGNNVRHYDVVGRTEMTYADRIAYDAGRYTSYDYTSGYNTHNILINAQNLYATGSGTWAGMVNTTQEGNATNLFIGEGFTRIEAWGACYAPYISAVYMPDSMLVVGEYAFTECYNLQRVHFSSLTEQIQAQAFSNCSSLKQADFSKCNAVPTLSSYNAFSGCPNDFEILVPASLYSTWINATGWRNLSSHIKSIS